MKPTVSIISNLSLEHRDYLGSTLAQIAGEKGGIIKKGVPLVTGVRQPGALSILSEIAAARSAPVYRLGKDFRVRRKPGGGFTFFGTHDRWPNMETSLKGRHQVDNAALSLAACQLLNPRRDRHLRRRLPTGLAPPLLARKTRSRLRVSPDHSGRRPQSGRRSKPGCLPDPGNRTTPRHYGHWHPG